MPIDKPSFFGVTVAPPGQSVGLGLTFGRQVTERSRVALTGCAIGSDFKKDLWYNVGVDFERDLVHLGKKWDVFLGTSANLTGKINQVWVPGPVLPASTTKPDAGTTYTVDGGELRPEHTLSYGLGVGPGVRFRFLDNKGYVSASWPWGVRLSGDVMGATWGPSLRVGFQF